MKISVIILTYNSEKTVESALKSAIGFDEIIIVDSKSNDLTVEICKKYTNNIFYNKLIGFNQIRTFGIEKSKNDWIFMLDSDEVISNELLNEILSLNLESTSFSAFKMPRQNIMLNKIIRHGTFYPDYQIRLFNKNKSVYKNKRIHEEIIISGEIGILKNHIIHNTSFITIKNIIEKTKKYTDLEVKDLIETHEKISIIKLVFYPVFRFFWAYILLLGFLDGKQGLILAILGSYYMFLKYYKYFLEKK